MSRARTRTTHHADLVLLRKLLGYTLTEKQRDAFSEMADGLEGREDLTLSAKQRQWASSVLGALEPTYENLVSEGKVPRGNDVPTPPALQHLPKRPPHRRHEVDE